MTRTWTRARCTTPEHALRARSLRHTLMLVTCTIRLKFWVSSCHPYTCASLLEFTSLTLYFDLSFTIFSLFFSLMHFEQHTELDNLIAMQNLRTSANKGSNDAYDVSVSLTCYRGLDRRWASCHRLQKCSCRTLCAHKLCRGRISPYSQIQRHSFGDAHVLRFQDRQARQGLCGRERRGRFVVRKQQRWVRHETKKARRWSKTYTYNKPFQTLEPCVYVRTHEDVQMWLCTRSVQKNVRATGGYVYTLGTLFPGHPNFPSSRRIDFLGSESLDAQPNCVDSFNDATDPFAPPFFVFFSGLLISPNMSEDL